MMSICKRIAPTQRNQAPRRAAATAAALLWALTGSTASAQFGTDRYRDGGESFETNCAGVDVREDLVFDDGKQDDPDYADLPGAYFLTCGIASITSSEPGGGNGHSAARLYHPPPEVVIGDMDGSTVLTGQLTRGYEQSWNLEISFFSPAHELALNVLDLDPRGKLTAKYDFADGTSEQREEISDAGGTARIDDTWPRGVTQLHLSYESMNDSIATPDEWFIDNLRFNHWGCGDGELEDSAANGENPHPEACDDGRNGVQCDGCTDSCTISPVGCLVGGTCVAHGSVDPKSDGCLICNNLTPGDSDVYGYNQRRPDCGEDGLTCTEDECDGDGNCTHTPVPGSCAVANQCFSNGAINPRNACQICDAEANPRGWTARPMGTSCDDGDVCTDSTPSDGADHNGDVCNDQGTCVGGQAVLCNDGLGCTRDTCDPGMGCGVGAIDGCLIPDSSGNPTCHATGDRPAGSPCEECNPTVDPRNWVSRDAGTRCGESSCEAGTLTPAPLCDAAGECVGQAPKVCESEVCSEPSACSSGCADDSECPEGSFCDNGVCQPDAPPGQACDRPDQCESGFCVDGVCCNSACDGPCQLCNAEGNVGVCTEIERDDENCGSTNTKPNPNGEICEADADCQSGHCVDGVCCDGTCEGLCEACNLPNRQGICSPHPLETDPDGECDTMCNGDRACVEYETRGNGWCSMQPASQRRLPPIILSLLALAALGLWTRRRQRRPTRPQTRLRG